MSIFLALLLCDVIVVSVWSFGDDLERDQNINVMQPPFRHDHNRRYLGAHTTRSHSNVAAAAGSRASSATSPFEVHYIISEEIPLDSYIGNILVDTHLASRFAPEVVKTLRFRFLNQPTIGSNAFALDAATGHLSTASRIDRETLCSAEVTSSTASGSVTGSEVCKIRLDVAIQPVQYFQIIRVAVEVLDVNDNSPQFANGFRHHELLETSLLGSTLTSPTATDLDSPPFSIARYRLDGNADDADYFRLRVDRKPDGSTDVKLVLVKPLDRESRDVHQLIVVAFDGGNPPRTGTADVTVVVVDANDNRPTFDQLVYEATVSENVPEMSSLIRIQARDLDSGVNGLIKYQLSASAIQAGYGKLLKIDEVTGDVYVVGHLDRERVSTYHVTVTATDNGLEPLNAEARLVIHVDDVNDCRPEIVVNTLSSSVSNGIGAVAATATVSEDATPGTFVAHLIVTDSDVGQNGLVDCIMTSMSADKFRLERLYEETEFQVVTTHGLDREQRAEYQLQVVCTDRGSPLSMSNTAILTVNITDVNDNVPVFSQPTYTAQLLENNYVGVVVVQASASDVDSGLNGLVLYSLDGESNVMKFFQVNSTSGVILAVQSIDYETHKLMKFNVIASDQGTPPKSATAAVSVTIHDVNDEKPTFDRPIYSLGLEENQPAGFEVGILSAHDADSPPYNELSYELVPAGSLSDAFQIDRKSGRIVTTRPLDREQQAVYQLVAVAHDDRARMVLSSTVPVTIQVMDRNDNRPVFIEPFTDNNKTAAVIHLSSSEASRKGAFVTQIKATDEDAGENAALKYSIDGDDSSVLWIDEASGVLSLLDGILSDNVTLSVRVTVTDAGVPPLSTSANVSIAIDCRWKSSESSAASGLAGSSSRDQTDRRRLAAAGEDDDAWMALVVVWVACSSGLVAIVVLVCVVASVMRRRLSTKEVDWPPGPADSQHQKLVNADGTCLAHPRYGINGSSDVTVTSLLPGTTTATTTIKCNSNDLQYAPSPVMVALSGKPSSHRHGHRHNHRHHHHLHSNSNNNNNGTANTQLHHQQVQHSCGSVDIVDGKRKNCLRHPFGRHVMTTDGQLQRTTSCPHHSPPAATTQRLVLTSGGDGATTTLDYTSTTLPPAGLNGMMTLPVYRGYDAINNWRHHKHRASTDCDHHHRHHLYGNTYNNKAIPRKGIQDVTTPPPPCPPSPATSRDLDLSPRDILEQRLARTASATFSCDSANSDSYV